MNDSSSASSCIETTLPGTLTGKPVKMRFELDCRHRLVNFQLPCGLRIAATSDNLVNAKRNSVIGLNGKSICFVEHLLAAINLLNIGGLTIHLDSPEIPLDDGSASIWMKLLAPLRQSSPPQSETLSLNRPLSVSDERGRAVFALPAPKFELTYLFEYPHNRSRTWVDWSLEDSLNDLASSRTFASKPENKLMNKLGEFLSYDSTGFDLPFRCPHEPAMHKLLDLYGDLALAGVEPHRWQAKFVSIRGGHELNTQLAKVLRAELLLLS